MEGSQMSIVITGKHPEYLAMRAAIRCEESMAACEKTAGENVPALFGVDRMLAETFVRYRDGFDESRMNAGFLVGEMMRERGYTKGKDHVPGPEGSFAKTGTMWVRGH
jgi:hypothetical protein